MVGTLLEIPKNMPQRVEVGVLGSGKFGVENRAGHLDSPLSLSIDSQFQKSPVIGKASTKTAFTYPVNHVENTPYNDSVHHHNYPNYKHIRLSYW